MDANARRAIVVACATGVLAGIGLTLRSPWDLVTRIPWVLAVGGPLAVVLLQPALLVDARPWARALGQLLPGLAVVAAVQDALPFRTSLPGVEPFATEVASLALLAIWVVATGVVAAWSWLRAPRLDRERILLYGGAAAAVALLLDVVPFFFVAEFAALLAVAGFTRAPTAWARAAIAASLVLTVGAIAVWAATGALWPPRIILDDAAFERGVLPVLLVALGVFVVVLLRRPARGAPA